MNSQEIVNYVMNTPHNTNPAILKQMLDANGGGAVVSSADWNAAEGEPGYIKSRTHYIEMKSIYSLGQPALETVGDYKKVSDEPIPNHGWTELELTWIAMASGQRNKVVVTRSEFFASFGAYHEIPYYLLSVENECEIDGNTYTRGVWISAGVFFESINAIYKKMLPEYYIPDTIARVEDVLKMTKMTEPCFGRVYFTGNQVFYGYIDNNENMYIDFIPELDKRYLIQIGDDLYGDNSYLYGVVHFVDEGYGLTVVMHHGDEQTNVGNEWAVRMVNWAGARFDYHVGENKTYVETNDMFDGDGYTAHTLRITEYSLSDNPDEYGDELVKKISGDYLVGAKAVEDAVGETVSAEKFNELLLSLRQGGFLKW